MPHPPDRDADLTGLRRRTARLRELFVRSGSHDTIDAEVTGPVEGQVAVGKGIVQIGRVVVPVWGLVGAVGVFAVLVAFVPYGIGVAFPTPPPTVTPDPRPVAMSGLFNVAVARFGRVGADGIVRASPEGDKLSRWVYESLRDEVAKLPADMHVELWHDSQPAMKAVELGVIPGRGPDERKAAAEQLAAHVKAHLVVFGNLVEQGDAVDFMPEFYVYTLRPGSDGIVGEHRLGSPIPIAAGTNFDDPDQTISLNRALSARARVLTGLAVGLVYEFAGDLDTSLSVLEALDTDLANLPDTSSRVVLYLFAGRAAQLAAAMLRDEDAAGHAADRAARAQTLEDLARRYFEKILDVEERYARAYIGLGNLSYDRAVRQLPERRLDHTDLDDAIDSFLKAVAYAQQAHEPDVEARARLSVANAYVYRAEAGRLRGEADTAAEDFTTAEEQFRAAHALAKPTEHRLLAQSLLGLGTVIEQRSARVAGDGDSAGAEGLKLAARAAFEACIAHGVAGASDWYLRDKIAPVCTAGRRRLAP